MFFEHSVEVNAVVDGRGTEARAREVRLEMLFEGFAANAQVGHRFT
jgi:hypothetical protein